MSYCGVLTCTNSREMCPDKSIKFHRFPKDNERVLERWKKFCNRKTWCPKSEYICSDHFRECDYKKGPNLRRLKKNGKRKN